MLNIVPFGAEFLRRFLVFPYVSLCKSLRPLGGDIHYPRDFIYTNLSLLSPNMLLAKYQCILTSGSLEKDF